MKNWKELYEKLKDKKLDSDLKDLSLKIENKTIKKEEYDEYKRLCRIKENMHKIKNLIEFKEILNEEQREISEEIKNRKERENQEKSSDIELEELEKEQEKLNEEKSIIEKQLKNKELKEEEKTELSKKRIELIKKLEENSHNYMIIKSKSNEKSSSNDNSKSKFKDMSYEELEIRRDNVLNKISKVNMAASRLVEGKSWNAIEVTLDNWTWKNRKLTSKDGKIKEKINNAKAMQGNTKTDLKQGNRESSAKGNRKPENKENNAKGNKKSENKESEKEETSLVVTSEFDKKHPVIAKIKNFFKGIGKGLYNIFYEVTEEKIKTEEKIEENKKEDEDFKKYLKEIAEKGYKGIEKDKQKMQEDRERKSKEEAYKRFKEAKLAAYNREAEKYGKEYANKSVRENIFKNGLKVSGLTEEQDKDSTESENKETIKDENGKQGDILKLEDKQSLDKNRETTQKDEDTAKDNKSEKVIEVIKVSADNMEILKKPTQRGDGIKINQNSGTQQGKKGTKQNSNKGTQKAKNGTKQNKGTHKERGGANANRYFDLEDEGRI